jgi:hypothetical protein
MKEINGGRPLNPSEQFRLVHQGRPAFAETPELVPRRQKLRRSRISGNSLTEMNWSENERT